MSDMPIDEQPVTAPDVRDIVRQAIEEFVRTEQRQAEPAYKTELQDERKRREGLEARLNQLVEENRKARATAEETDRHSQIRSELQRAGISKLDLAFRAVKDEIVRSSDGRLQAKGTEGKSLQDYDLGVSYRRIQSYCRRGLRVAVERKARPEIANKWTAQELRSTASSRGMSKEDLDRVRQHISKLASQALRGA